MKEEKVTEADIAKKEAEELAKAIKESLDLENERKNMEEKEKAMLEVSLILNLLFQIASYTRITYYEPSK